MVILVVKLMFFLLIFHGNLLMSLNWHPSILWCFERDRVSFRFWKGAKSSYGILVSESSESIASSIFWREGTGLLEKFLISSRIGTFSRAWYIRHAGRSLSVSVSICMHSVVMPPLQVATTITGYSVCVRPLAVLPLKSSHVPVFETRQLPGYNALEFWQVPFFS